MEIKLIATDIDGTLLDCNKNISETTREFFNEFKKNGGIVVLSTGRSYPSTKKVMENLGLEGIAITSNGAMIVDSKTDEVIFYRPVEEKHTKILINLARKHDIHLNLYQGNDLVVENKEREESKNYASICMIQPVEKSFDELENYITTKTVFIAEPAKLKLLEADVRKELGDEVYITYSKKTYLEILHRDVNKGSALLKILETFNIPKENVAAFGDELNDKEML
ncbi:MAG: Cof-type HAD-IIB family hydrolase, partial [Fusobacteriaceae bacterium]